MVSENYNYEPFFDFLVNMRNLIRSCLSNENPRKQDFLGHSPAVYRMEKMCDVRQHLCRITEHLLSEKTNDLGFRPGLTQTRLYHHRSSLEA